MSSDTPATPHPDPKSQGGHEDSESIPGTVITLGVVTLFLALSGLLGYWLVAHKGAKFLAEYACYALPALAAVTASMTVFGKRTQELFWFSGISVFLGLIIFTYSQGSLPSLWTMVVYLFGVAVTIGIMPLANHIEKKRGKESNVLSGIVGLAFLIFAVAEGVAWTSILNQPNTSIVVAKNLSCIQQGKTPSGQLMLTCTEN